MERTQQHVLSCTARLLAREGVDAVTFSRVSQVSRIARSTLYRHWQSRDELVCAAAMPGFDSETLGAQIGAHQFVLNYLVQTSDALMDLSTQIDFAHALHVAQTDEIVRRNFRLIAESFRRVLEDRLGPLDAWDHARVVGPVFFQAVVMGQRPDTQTLDRWVGDILAMPRGTSETTGRGERPGVVPGNTGSSGSSGSGNMGR